MTGDKVETRTLRAGAEFCFFFFQAEDGIRDYKVTGVQTCALPICGSELHEKWNDLWARYKGEQPELAEQLDFMRFRELPPGWAKDIPSFPADEKGADRKSVV